MNARSSSLTVAVSTPTILLSYSPKYISSKSFDVPSLLLYVSAINSMTSQPNEVQKTTPQTATVSIFFDYDEIRDVDLGLGIIKFEFKAMLNGGYIVRAAITDIRFNYLRRLIKAGYFKNARKDPTLIRFELNDGSGDSEVDINKTKMQTAILLSINVKTRGFDESRIEFVAIDPASWFLNRGVAKGSVYKGKLSTVISNIIEEYTRGQIKYEVTETEDSDQNKWYMMRMDPKTWIGSVMEWASAITKTKTNFIIESDGFNFSIREQGLIPSKERGFYESFTGVNEIKESELLIDNALSLVEARLLTHGCSAVAGTYIENVPVDDSTTTKKQLARVPESESDMPHSFFKPDLDNKAINSTGYSRVDSIPEIYSGGELGIEYNNYIDGRARGMYLAMVNNLIRTRIRVRGQASLFDSKGLGVDTMYIRWMDTFERGEYYWYTGNWLLYGFNHVLEKGAWYTELYLSRFDMDANGIKNPGR